MGEAIEAFAMSVQREGLMRPAQTAQAPAAPPSMAPDGELPALEAFNDMKDLLLLDPVHEVDEQQGWPKAQAD
jgi:hypothetical protein